MIWNVPPEMRDGIAAMTATRLNLQNAIAIQIGTNFTCKKVIFYFSDWHL